MVLGISTLWAQSINTSDPSHISVAPTIEVGNKHCPVTGRAVGEMGPLVKHEYNGKIYNLCCGMCPKTFDSDPSKYAKIAQDDAAQNGKYTGKN